MIGERTYKRFLAQREAERAKEPVCKRRCSGALHRERVCRKMETTLSCLPTADRYRTEWSYLIENLSEESTESDSATCTTRTVHRASQRHERSVKAKHF
jgi:hypothetical protein